MEHAERIAALEARENETVRRLDDQDDDLKAIRKDVEEIRNVISHYKGFAGGVIFAVATLAGLIGAGVTAIWHRLAG